MQEQQPSSLPEAPKLSFSEDLWDGFELLKDKTSKGLEQCNDVLDFFRRLSSLEDEYCKNLSKLLQRFANLQDKGTLGEGWKSVYSLLDVQINFHRNLSLNLINNLCHPIQALLREMETKRKQLVTYGVKLRSDLKEHSESVKRVQAKYEKACKEAESARTELLAFNNEPQNNSAVVRLEKKLDRLDADSQSAEIQYKNTVSAANKFLDAYQTEKYPGVLNEFEQFEITRIHFLKSNIRNFVGLMNEFPPTLEAELKKSTATIDAIDADRDIQQFINENRQTKHLMPLFAMVPYEEGKLAPAKPSSPALPMKIFDQLTKYKWTTEEPANQQAVFGVSLDQIMARQKTQFPELLVPKVMAMLVEGIIALGGFNMEGIFRINAPLQEIQTLKKQIGKGNYDITPSDVHVLGTLLKTYLRELPEPLIPTSYYDVCIANPQQAREIALRLPSAHYRVLSYLIAFLQVFTRPEYLANNRMDTVNLTTIFTPVILRCPYNDPSFILANSSLERQFVEALIRSMPPPDATLLGPVLASYVYPQTQAAPAGKESNSAPTPKVETSDNKSVDASAGSKQQETYAQEEESVGYQSTSPETELLPLNK
jgi:hypothetical protein